MNSRRPTSGGSRARWVSDGSAGTCGTPSARNASAAGRAPVRSAVRADSPPHGAAVAERRGERQRHQVRAQRGELARGVDQRVRRRPRPRQVEVGPVGDHVQVRRAFLGRDPPVPPLPGVERRLDDVLRAHRVEPDRRDTEAPRGCGRVEPLLVGTEGGDGRLHRGVDPRPDLQTLRDAPQQGAVLVEALVALDVPPLALDAGVADAQVGQVGRVFGQRVDDVLQLVEGGVGEVSERPVGTQQRALVLDPVPEPRHRPAVKAMRPVTGSASSSRTRAVSPGRRTPAQRAITGGSST